ncbi:TPA_asm: N [Morus betacytorhabdovirus 1]|nr:TPA_asm: N [Morus betacytorhabdovirus 1]
MASTSMIAGGISKEAQLMEQFGNTPNIVLTTLTNKEFNSKTFMSTPIYNNSGEVLSGEALDSLGMMLTEVANKGFKDGRTAKLIYLLASQLRDPLSPDQLILKESQFTEKISYNAESWGFNFSEEEMTAQDQADLEPLPKTDSEWETFAMRTFVHPETGGLSAEEAEKRIEGAKISHISGVRSSRSLAYVNAKKKQDKKGSGSVLAKGKTGATSTYWPFVAAYLIKILVKTPENVMLGEEHMRNRYMGFYPEGVPVELKLNVEGLKTLQLRLKSDPAVLQSWIAWTAEYESEQDATTNNAGIIRYLANMQFSYNGMHAYGLFREVLLATRWTPGEAIVKMWMTPTADALRMIHKIIMEHESTLSADGKANKKSTYFKYARIIDPQHFLSLQPTQCLSLLYLCCKILNHYTTRTELSDPMRMIALQKMGPERKEYLDCMSEEIILRSEEDNTEKTSIEIAAAAKYRSRKTVPEAKINTGLAALEAIQQKMNARRKKQAEAGEE